MENQDEIIYIKRILDGETNLYSYFINQHSSSIYSLIFPIVRIKEDAEELTQDAFLKAFRKLDTFKGRVNVGAYSSSVLFALEAYITKILLYIVKM